MIIWINGAFGAGKTTVAFELHRRVPHSFVFDPENFGFFLGENLPECLKKGDFQDYELWRNVSLETLTLIDEEYDGVVFVPMTLYKKQYYDDIVGRLIKNGVDVKHVILYASKETLLKRLNFRLARGDTWAKSHIEVCIQSFDSEITEEKIITDNLTITQVVEEVACRTGIRLEKDTRSRTRKKADRLWTLAQHIRR